MTLIKDIALLSEAARLNVSVFNQTLPKVDEDHAKSRIENAVATTSEALTDLILTGVESINSSANEIVGPTLEGLLDTLAQQDQPTVVRLQEVDRADAVHPGEVISVMSVDTLDQAAYEARQHDIPVDEE